MPKATEQATGATAETPTPLAHDAASTGTQGTGDLSWPHTPVGVPRGAVVLVSQSGSVTDEVSAVSYGGVPMSRVKFVTRSPGVSGAVYAYFLGVAVPAGAQTVTVTVSGATLKQAVAVTQTASLDCQVDVSGQVSGQLANPAVTLPTTPGQTTAIYAVAHISTGTASVAVAGGCTQLLEQEGTGVNDISSMLKLTLLGTGGNQTVGWTCAASQTAAAAVAIRQVADPVPARIEYADRFH